MRRAPDPRPPSSLAFSLSLLIAFAGACGVDPPIDERRMSIVNGQKSTDSFLPAAGALVVNVPGFYMIFCSGTLISKRAVLTAAHCIENEMPPNVPIGFFYGTNTKIGAPATQIVPIGGEYPHPKYTFQAQPPNDWNDIGILALSEDAPVEPIKMIRPDEVAAAIKVGNPVTIVGFGLTVPGDQNSTGIKHQGQTTLSQVLAKDIFLSSTTGTNTCEGDSGGGTFVNFGGTSGPPDWRLIGVTSRGGQNCTLGSLQTRVDTYLDWIHGIVPDIPCGSGLKDDNNCTPPPPPKNKIGESCTKSDECEDDLCIFIDGKGICSKFCDTRASNCPPGLICHALDETNKGACAKPLPKGLGAPCTDHAECKSNLCASLGDERFCTKKCDPGVEGDCGDGMTCEPAGGVIENVCAPSEKSDDGGCAVSGRAAGLPLLLLLALSLIAIRRCRKRTTTDEH